MNIFKKVWGAIWNTRHSKVWFIVTSVLIVLTLTINIVLSQSVFLKETLSSVFGGETRVLTSGDPSKFQYFKSDYKTKEETLAAANALNEQIVEEGITLLKNDGTLPLATSASSKMKVSIFGKNSDNLVYGGSGSSGGAGNKDNATIYDSLTAANFDVNPTLKNFYNDKNASGKGRDSSPNMGSILRGFGTGETAQSLYTAEVKSSYTTYNDAALIVISRIGGEGYDLPREMKGVAGARSESDHYLQLDQNETDLIQEVSKSFEKIIMVINCSTSMELGFLDDTTHYAYSDKIKAAVWIGNPGKTGINALGRVLNGTVNPSGRTVDTYARDFKKDPTWANFSDNMVAGGNRYYQGSEARPYYQVEYEESIYMGYRYYETRFGGDESAYKNNVVFPFGYGLSYTSFDWTIKSTVPSRNAELKENSEISVTVKVRNTGTKAGKDVVQLYYSSPYSSGGVQKASSTLAAFAKTPVIMPGAEADVTLKFTARSMASYDYRDFNSNGYSSYELDAGTYTMRLSNNIHKLEEAFTYTVSNDIVYPFDEATGYMIENRFDEASDYISTYLTRDNWEGTWPVAPTQEERTKDADFFNRLKYTTNDKETDPWYTDYTPVYGKKGSTKLYELIGKDYNDPLWNNILDQITIDDMALLIGSGNYKTANIDYIGKPRTLDPDGPTGFSAFMGDPSVYGTAFYASECVIGATWNVELAEAMGEMIGNEGIMGNKKGDGTSYSGWYAPAANIHRSPFSGRNFEYYSEDGLFSGKMGAATVKGAMSKGVYCYIKHFAVNDQETNRDSNGILTWLDEQAMREIYLKPFEIMVKEAKTTAIMSSFNRIGMEWAGGSYDLLTEVLRNEWGFKGMVITDYNLYDHMPADQMIRTGGDLNLTQGKLPSVSSAALTPTQILSMRNATKNILYTVANSNGMNGWGEGVAYTYMPPMWMIVMWIISAAVVVGVSVWGVFAIRGGLKRKKK